MSPVQAPVLCVESTTGIDVSLPLAGPGVRSYAFVIDWLIRLVLGTSWYVVGAIIYNGRLGLNPPLSNSGRWFGLIVLPALAIYFLYHPLVESAMRGRTPGQERGRDRDADRSADVPDEVEEAAGVADLFVLQRSIGRRADRNEDEA